MWEIVEAILRFRGGYTNICGDYTTFCGGYTMLEVNLVLGCSLGQAKQFPFISLYYILVLH